MTVYRVSNIYADQSMDALVEARAPQDAKRYVLEDLENHPTVIPIEFTDPRVWEVERVFSELIYRSSGAALV
jgi:hypothetical protein